jgi:hypothetical protein
MERVDEVIGFLELVGWIAGVVGLAAAITYAVIKLFPGKDDAATAGKPSGEQPS